MVINPQSVVIVGSGFAGFGAARRLAEQIRKRRLSHIRIVVVSPVDHMLYYPLLPDIVGGAADARSAMVPLAGMLPGVHTICGTVERVDLEGKRLTYLDREQRSSEIGWDRLILAPGSVSRLFDIPGLTEYSRGFKTTADALLLRDHIVEQLEWAVTDQDAESAKARRTVVVVGASFTGTVLVATIRAVADAAAKQLGFDPSAVDVLLVDLAKQVMPEIGATLSATAMKVLRDHGIDIRLGHTLSEVGPDYAILDDGTRVATRTVLWVAGVAAAPLIETLGLPTDHGRLVVQTDLQVPGHPDLFAAGDAAAIPDRANPGKIAAPTAQHAVRQAKVLARNVLASLGQGTTVEYRHHDLGMVADLGPWKAIANPFGMQLTGVPAKVVTRMQRLWSIPRAYNKCQAAFAYTVGAAFPRTLVSFGLSPKVWRQTDPATAADD